MPSPINIITYHETVSNMHSVYLEHAEASMKAATDEIRHVMCRLMGYGKIMVIPRLIEWSPPSGKCLAFEALTKTCKTCEIWEARKGTPVFEKFAGSYTCPINHTGSMEAVGVICCLEKSVETRKSQYENYIGDGDSKALNR